MNDWQTSPAHWPAHPVPNPDTVYWGITVREHFAGQALVGVLAAFGPLKSDPKVSQEAMTKMVAEASVRIADAMIEALKGGAR